MFYYKFNLLLENMSWHGSKSCKMKNLISPQWLRDIKDRNYPKWRIDTFFSNLKSGIPNLNSPPTFSSFS